jgi:hypothetical protein
MKLSRTLRSTVAAVGTFICVAASAHAQTYSIDWFTIDGGGGTSTGGNYSLSGTIGQPDAGLMTGGSYSLAGGFWSIQAIDIPGFPRLSITPAGNEVIISWTPGTPGFVLQGNGSFNAASWADAPSGSTNPITVPAAAAARFYRLRKP